MSDSFVLMPWFGDFSAVEQRAFSQASRAAEKVSTEESTE